MTLKNLKDIEVVNWQFSDVDRWWNYGNEFKPNKSEFDQIVWNDFNGNFLDSASFMWNGGLTATAHVAEYLLNRIFRVNIENKKKQPQSYFFYIEKKLEQWSPDGAYGTVYKVSLYLDVWLTYILHPQLDISAWSNRFHHEWPNLQSVVRGFLKNDNLLLDNQYTMIQKVKFLDNSEIPLIKKNPLYPDQNSVIYKQKFKYKNLITYYVFKEKKESGYKKGYNNIILIPELLDTSHYVDTDNLRNLKREQCPFYIEQFGYNSPQKTYVLNDERNLLNLVDRRLDYPAGLGDFVGCFIGPNFFRTGAMINYSVNLGLINDINIASVVPINQYSADREVIGFLCLRISKEPSHLKTYPNSEIDNIVKAVKNGLYPLGDDKAWTTTFANNLMFSDKFVYVDRLGLYSENTEIPIFTDRYYEWLAQTKPNRDVAINVAKQQMALGIAGNIFGGFMGLAKSFAGGAIGDFNTAFGGAQQFVGESTLGIAKTVTQYQNTLTKIEAEKETQRLKTSTEMTSSDVSFLQRYEQLGEGLNLEGNVEEMPLVLTTNKSERSFELFVGTKKENIIDLYNFAGFETGWYRINKKIWEIEKGYIRIPQAVVNSNVFNVFTNEEKTAIIKLLSNGVRVGFKDEVDNDFN